jgi:eukaryotic-like serine/threonine-protein kinase
MSRTCDDCGGEIPLNAPQGLCPNCLMGVAAAKFENVESDAWHFREAESEPERVIGRIHYFGDYELLAEIARGGMGIVYRARQQSLKRVVAVKVLLFGQFSSDDFVKQFKIEAQAAASLQHPNIVAIHEIGEDDGHHYFSMDYVEGRDLASVIRDGPLPCKRAAKYMATIARAVHYAHERGILHRDLKPSNILIDQLDQPRVTDFGLAKRLNGESGAISSGRAVGSPNYMPPEQIEPARGKASSASDVYSMGAILYHLLTGRPPFTAATLEETLLQALNSEVIPPRLLNPGVPRDLEIICLKCLEKEGCDGTGLRWSWLKIWRVGWRVE